METEEQVVVFQLDQETYGVAIASVHEIIRLQAITTVPKTPEFVEGVINLRGRIIPVIDLRRRFGLPDGTRTQAARIMVVEIGETTVGMIVDSVSEVLRLNREAIEPPPPMVTGVDSSFIQGVGKVGERLIIILDLSRILHRTEKEELERGSYLEAVAEA